MSKYISAKKVWKNTSKKIDFKTWLNSIIKKLNLIQGTDYITYTTGSGKSISLNKERFKFKIEQARSKVN